MDSKINISYFDMYSKKLGFFFNNHEKISSYNGLFLSLVYIFVSLILFIQQIIIMIKRKELNVYDSTIYAQEMPNINVDINQLYFAFGLEDPLTSNRFIDEGIYIPKIAFVEKKKINDKLVTVNTTFLPLERCDVTNFGKTYQHLFLKDELNNSYCLKDFNYNLNFVGGYKYEKFSYIRLRIYPCVNNSENNNSCKPQEEIDHYMASGYFSIIIKDFGLNPSNYFFPTIPTLQDLYTTIDKKIYRNYILNFGVTETHTDTGLFNENIEKGRYFQYRKETQTFSFRDEHEYYEGKSIILVQFKLDDTIVIQKRSYTKIPEIFSRIGGYMQLMNTIFLLISSFINRLYSDIKIINSIFNFNIKENKMIIKFKSLKEFNHTAISKKVNSIFYSSRLVNSTRHESENKSKNNLIIKEKEYPDITALNISKNNKIIDNSNISIKIYKKDNTTPFEDSKIDSSKSKKEERNNNEKSVHFNIDNLRKSLFYTENNKEKTSVNSQDFKDHINIYIYDYLCFGKKYKRYNYIQLYKKGKNFYRKKIDIVYIFTFLTFLEKFIKK